jgi:outer membrane protein TolC
LLASGVDAAQASDVVDELTVLQLNEWMAQMRAAVDDHPRVRAAELQAEASEAGVDQARAARLPQITLSSEVGNDRSVRDGRMRLSNGWKPAISPRKRRPMKLDCVLRKP